jgi:putative lipoic acid-binding regulatory protein
MTDTEAPKIEFPCDYPIKIVGAAAADFRETVVTIVEAHAPEVREFEITENLSRSGKWISVRIKIRATGEEQLRTIFAELKATGRVQMVL